MLACLAVGPVWSDDSEEFTKITERWRDAYNAGDTSAVAALCAEDGMLMPPNAETAKGHEAIEACVKTLMTELPGKISTVTVHTASSGDLGFAQGTYSFVDDDGNTTDNGKWLMVLEKVKGKWDIQHDIFNSDNPIPE
jgi:uncharacterized protein (TIGR02246 family)